MVYKFKKMAISQTLTITDEEQKDEIIFPEGEFWSDEPPLEIDILPPLTS